MKKLLFLLSVLGMLSCTGNTGLEKVLKLSGDNRPELERVLVHYQDSGLKQDAARFLIENMPGSHGMNSLSQKRLQPIYDAYDAISRASGYRTDREWGERIDSLAESHPFLFSMPAQTMDLQHVKAEYLIKEMARKQGVTEELKGKDMMKWIGLMNNIRACADEIVLNDIVYS